MARPRDAPRVGGCGPGPAPRQPHDGGLGGTGSRGRERAEPRVASKAPQRGVFAATFAGRLVYRLLARRMGYRKEYPVRHPGDGFWTVTLVERDVTSVGRRGCPGPVTRPRVAGVHRPLPVRIGRTPTNRPSYPPIRPGRTTGLSMP